MFLFDFPSGESPRSLPVQRDGWPKMRPLFSPDSDYGGGGGPFALLGDFLVGVDPNTFKVVIDNPNNVFLNPDFGKLINTFTQEGVDSRRTVRLRLRITF